MSAGVQIEPTSIRVWKEINLVNLMKS